MRAFPRTAMLLAALSLVASSGCSRDAEEPSGAAGSGQPSTSDASGTPEATTSATPDDSSDDGTGGSPSEGDVLPDDATLTDRLLATAAVPGLNSSWKWQDGETGPAGSEPFGACAKVDLASIGATEVVGRSYFPPVDTDDNAAEQIAEFPDTTTAARAAKVLASWHADCAARISSTHPKFKVGPVTAVPTSTGKGGWYLVSWVPPGAEEGRFHAFGTVQDGTRLAVLSIDNGGQDYNYPAGKEPMVEMVAAAAERLG